MTRLVNNLGFSTFLFPLLLGSGTFASPQKIKQAAPTLIFQEPAGDFSFKTELAGWQLIPSAMSENGKVFVVKKSASTGQLVTVLSLRRDESKYSSAKAYAERWLRDYPKFGFELIFARSRNVEKADGYEMELKANETDKTIHQLIIQKNKKAFVFTCSDQTDRFKETLEGCEKVFSSLRF